MWRVVWIALFACAPQQPLQPSYFNAQRAADAPANCQETLACYSQCAPLTEECMLLCDRESLPSHSDKARAVTYCSAQHGCGDQLCTDAKCAPQMQACTAPMVAPAPSPMRPPPPSQPPPSQPGPALQPQPPPPPY